MVGTELVFSARLEHPSHTGGPTIYVPWHGGEVRSISLGDVVRWGKMTREGDFCVYLVAEVDGKAYAIDGKGRSADEEKEIRRQCRRFKARWPSMRGWGFAFAMEDEKPAPPIRTLAKGENSPRVSADEKHN